MTTSVFFDIGARDTSGGAWASTTAGIDRTAAANARLSTSFALSDRSARTFGSSFQGLGRAVARGDSLMNAFSGRLSQVLGIFGPLGFIVGGVAGGLLSFSDNADKAATSLGDLEGAVRDVESVQQSYAETIASTATAQSSATSQIVASTKREFDAKKSLLELEVARQRAALAAQQVEIEATTRQVASDVAGANQFRGDLPGAAGALLSQERRRQAAEFSESAREGLDTLKRLNAEATIAEQAILRAEEALNTRFADIGAGASTGGGGGGGGASRQRALADAIGSTNQSARDQQVTFASLAETTRLVDQANADLNQRFAEQDRQQQAAERSAASFSEGLLRIAFGAQTATEKLKALGLELLSEGLRGLFLGEGTFSSLGSIDFGSIFGFRANGGPVQAGRPYVVGERQPELFVPNQSGTILPRVPELSSGRGGGSINIGDTILNITQPGASAEQIRRIVAESQADTIRRIGEINRNDPGFLFT